jgi:short-subunit dehydrogenase
MTVATPKTIVITGASSGIGEALAVRYARPGTVLGLIGRNQERLERVAERCRSAGGQVRATVIDVRNRHLLGDWLRDFDRASPIDLIIANAGISTGTAFGRQVEDGDGSYLLMQINVLGVLNTVHPVLPLMLSRGRGQIAIMGSISGFVPLRDWPSYGASKAAMMNYGLALRDRVHAAGVRVNILCPGYTTTEMTKRIKGWRPFEVTAEVAAERIVRGLARDREVIAFPWILVLMSRLGALLPDGLRRLALRPFHFHMAEGSKPTAAGRADHGA